MHVVATLTQFLVAFALHQLSASFPGAMASDLRGPQTLATSALAVWVDESLLPSSECLVLLALVGVVWLLISWITRKHQITPAQEVVALCAIDSIIIRHELIGVRLRLPQWRPATIRASLIVVLSWLVRRSGVAQVPICFPAVSTDVSFGHAQVLEPRLLEMLLAVRVVVASAGEIATRERLCSTHGHRLVPTCSMSSSVALVATDAEASARSSTQAHALHAVTVL